MPASLKPTCSSCCKRGYWNAIAYGVAVILAFSAARTALDHIWDFRNAPESNWYWFWYWTTRKIGKIDTILAYTYSPTWLFADTLVLFLDVRDDLIDRYYPRPSPIRAILWWSTTVFVSSLQWIVFLGALRRYWWTRRAPVTGWSALAAVSVMAAVIVVCHILHHYGVRL